MTRYIQSSALLAICLFMALPAPRASASEEGIALAIVYDTSGSMREPVKDSSGKSSPKYVIANRALMAIARQIESYADTNSPGGPRKVECGLFIFDQTRGKEVIPFGPFARKAIEEWARSFASPSGNTPLGNALSDAGKRVMDSPLSKKHVLVITDGMNTSGPSPAVVLPRLQKQAVAKHEAVSVHFVAFDVDAKVFQPLKDLGATVVGAADEKQLGTQVQSILQNKILLEDEEKK